MHRSLLTSLTCTRFINLALPSANGKCLTRLLSITPVNLRETDEELIANLSKQVYEYKKELRKLVYGHPKSRLLKRNIANLQDTISSRQQPKSNEIFDLFKSMSSLRPTVISLEILSNGTSQMAPSVIIRTQLECYMFNVPEGTSRFISALHLGPNKLHDLFVTRGVWDCMGGIGGLLMTKDAQDKQEVRLHGPRNVKEYLTTIRPFMDSDYGNAQFPCTVEERTFENVKHEDNSLVVYYIPLFSMSDNTEVNSLETKFAHTAYLVEMKPKERAIDAFKLISKKVPKGPLIGQLKAGKAVTLPNGDVVQPEEVLMDETDDFANSVLIVDIDHVDKIRSVATNTHLRAYVDSNSTKKLGYLVHFTPEHVVNTPEYQEFINLFGLSCLNIIVNGSGEAVPMTDGPYNNQRMLNTLDQSVFPLLYPNITGNVQQKLIAPQENTNILRPKTYQKYPIRGNACSQDSSFAIGDEELEERRAFCPELKEKMEEFKETTATLTNSSEPQFPSVSFLGTSSACPTKYRNVSGYLLRLSDKSAAFVDVGEGSYGQMKVLYGPEKTEDILISLNAIFITHGHLDHINGMFMVIEKRIEAFQKRGLLYKPLIIVCNQVVRRPFSLYSQNFVKLEKMVKWIDTTVLSRPLTPEKDRALSQNKRPLRLPDKLWIETVTAFPGELFNPEEWNLKSAKAVFVHHTRMASGFVFETVCGKKLVFSGDTKPCKNLAVQGSNADLLIHEATFEDAYARDAERKRHSTTGQAISIGKEMNAKHVILSHFSARYPRCMVLSDELIESGNTAMATDFMVADWNKLKVIDKLAPVYKLMFERELKDLELKECQKRLKIKEEQEKKTRKSPDNPTEAPEEKRTKAVA
ncbi:unnamed protein product [Bursaphelenchus okinawaensis]|uniref:ribonuclease Z n=1 Tax=Bursaphelenchus okinawaensis TaxID=465554 RepID=A0A811KF97_9BILA|nr:unnamed protein product [Bursaphelenchus okinawaensis]CAG9102835.1 unnamed protein product [Bursaphelenchus okinawaensis]